MASNKSLKVAKLADTAPGISLNIIAEIKIHIYAKQQT